MTALTLDLRKVSAKDNDTQLLPTYIGVAFRSRIIVAFHTVFTGLY